MDSLFERDHSCYRHGMRIAIIGSGVSGIAAARTLQRLGFDVVLFERSQSIGGVWALAYPEVTLQNIESHYHFTDFPWPFKPNLHPTGAQIREYLDAAVRHFKLDLRLQHEVTTLREEANGWTVQTSSPNGQTSEFFDYVIVAVGHYSQTKTALDLPGKDDFQGQVLTEQDIRSLDVLKNKRVAVVGFGKTAVDLATFAAQRGSNVHHVFRAPRWLMPRTIFGVHMAKVIFARMSTAMFPAWVHSDGLEKKLHEHYPRAVAGFWKMITLMTRAQLGMHPFGRDSAAVERLRVLEPENTITYEMRSATALAPEDYFPFVIQGKIQPHRGKVRGLSKNALLLEDGREIPCDLVIMAIGHKSPGFPFLPEPYRSYMENEPDGTQLYRHLVHPKIPRLAFAGFNHGFFHLPGVEIGTLWTSAVIRGDLKLPSPDEMQRSAENVQAWKRANSLPEPSRAYGIATRFHQYLDILLMDLGVDPRRKRHPVLEWVEGYTANDYRDVLDEYERLRKTQKSPRTPRELDT
jgi:dimethylaniline monooxygenase (N-oxide forming)